MNDDIFICQGNNDNQKKKNMYDAPNVASCPPSPRPLKALIDFLSLESTLPFGGVTETDSLWSGVGNPHHRAESIQAIVGSHRSRPVAAEGFRPPVHLWWTSLCFAALGYTIGLWTSLCVDTDSVSLG